MKASNLFFTDEHRCETNECYKLKQSGVTRHEEDICHIPAAHTQHTRTISQHTGFFVSSSRMIFRFELITHTIKILDLSPPQGAGNICLEIFVKR